MNLQPIKVLIIDPDEASRNYLAATLGKSGFSVIGAASAREGLISAWQNLPQAIIVDPLLPDMQGIDLISRLRQDRRTANVPCIALSVGIDPQGINQLLSSGFNEFVNKSNQTVAEIQSLLAKMFKLEKKPKKGGYLVVFLSAKGGTGTSSLCANIAMCMGKRTATLKVAVVDMVLPIGSIAKIVGYNDQMNIVTVSAQDPNITTPLYFKDNLPKLPAWYFQLLAGSPDPESANQLAVARLTQIVSMIQDEFDFVIVDLGRSLSRISLPIIHQADLLALVLSTDASAVALTRTVLDYLTAQAVDINRIFPILNRAVGLEGITKAEADEALGLQIRATMPYMGGNFALANNRHEPIVTKFPSDSLSIMLFQAAEEMANQVHHLRDR